LKDASLTIEKGEILGLFGRNGSGKSTLLNILFGTLPADGGIIAIDKIKVNTTALLPKQCIAYGPQHSFLPKTVKVRDIIPIIHTTEAAQDAIFYDEHVAKVTAKKIGDLSLGELKYLEVVLLSQLPHPFLLLDEPFSMLAPLHKEKLQAFLIQLKDEKGILVTDHYFHDVLKIANRNTVIYEGSTQTVTSEEDLRKYEYLSKKNP
ncbi:MAG: ATP-binding cassette domain-containing protein, partial [Marinirhabdus sp.]|nr:ATP-binding cassette domain-containing protein [Marinirhabdus sp.]